MLTARSGVAETLMNLWCKEKAIADCILGMRDKELPLQVMLKEIRALSKKQYKVQNKINMLYAYHHQNQC